MNMIARDEFLRLVDLDLAGLKTFIRRDQLPAVPGPASGGRYTPLSALLLIIANEFANHQQVSRKRATEHASRGFIVGQRWSDIAKTSEALFRGRDVAHEIFLAVAELPGLEKPRAAVGTFAEIAATFPNPARLALANVSRAAAVLRMRAARHDIDLGDFWDE